MASILDQYLSKGLGIIELQLELQKLIKQYNKFTNRYLFIYASDINKAKAKNVDVSLDQDDFYNIQDILREINNDKVDFYIETPGGSGEVAEEIARFLRKKFSEVNFVVAGESKSAGTILVLSGDNIYMTETGSLGPIDAQIKIGRSVISAYDYKEWVDEKREEAKNEGSLNPFDAIMISQISPGELYGVINSLKFATDLVEEWLAKYKFKNWKETRSRKIKVTQEYRRNRAKEVAELLCNHSNWRTHGRSLKIEDLSEILQIDNIDNEPKLAEIVYRIKTVIRLIFDMSTIYKIYYLDSFKLNKSFTVSPPINQVKPIRDKSKVQKSIPIEAVELEVNCPKCGKKHKVIGYIGISSKDIKTKGLKINPNITSNEILVCDNCKFALDLKPIKAQIENQTKKQITIR